MKSIIKSALVLSASLCFSAQSDAALTITIQAGRLDLANGSNAIAEGTLIQLINLGADGLFNSIDLSDGNATGNAAWVSGDDTLVTAIFSNGVDFTIGEAFDLRAGADTGANGELFRIFQFENNALAANTKLGIRWFPGIAASNFSSTTLAMGQAYGQFTDQSGASGSTVPWMIPVGGTVNASYDFHTLGTTELGGPDAATLGDASLSVIPEPAAIGMSLIGAAGLTLLRRRRA